MSASTSPTACPARASDREIGGDGRLADASLAAGDRDKPALATLAGQQNANFAHSGQALRYAPDVGFEFGVRSRGQPGYIEDDIRAPIVEANSGAAGRDRGKRGFKCSKIGHIARHRAIRSSRKSQFRRKVPKLVACAQSRQATL